MAGYKPLKITGMAAGLTQQREDFLLPDDGYPTLVNAYVWRERILRKKGFELLGRLQRNLANYPSTGAPLLGVTDGAGNFTGNIFTILIGLGLISSLEFPSIVLGSIGIHVNGDGTYIDDSAGNLSNGSGGTGNVNYVTGAFTILNSGQITSPIHLYLFQYYPGLPVMGIRTRELQNSANDMTIFFDQIYAYIFNNTTSLFQEWIPGTTWNAHAGDVTATDFFFSTNYWVSGTASSPFGTANTKLFWETNNTGQFGTNQDPPRISDGTTWVNFFPSTWSQIDATNYLANWLAMLPYRGRLVTFNTWEGPAANGLTQFSNRIRWSTIGNPFIPYTNVVPAAGSWRDDIRGQGGFLDIPTSEDIVAVGFVRDNLVIYCERSTWQLRYTGRSIAPFQIERVNSELGAESTFSAVQFDTSLVGIGDKGVVECDSYKSERIDVKIPDFVFSFTTNNNGVARVQGIRDFINRLAYWTVPVSSAYAPQVNQIYPNIRLVYNYENDSWATFTDSLTTLGNFQPGNSRTWLNTPLPWIECDFNWINQIQQDPEIVGGNQQGFIEYLNQLTNNDISLFISNITSDMINVTVTSPNHNLPQNSVIQISGIIDPVFSVLNGNIYGINIIDSNTFTLATYDPLSRDFSTPVSGIANSTYLGGGLIAIRENFNITSKKFNFLDDGQSIQIGYIDILMQSTEPSNPGAITLNMYLDYNDDDASNTLPENEIPDSSPPSPDTFFNSIIPTTSSLLNNKGGTKFWQRVYCATRANFLTIQYTFSNAQLNGIEQEQEVQIDAQVIWLRKGGRLSQF